MATKFLKRHGRTTSEVIAVEQPSDTYTKLTSASAPRSRGQFWDDVTPEGGGGSAFAHLSEDTGNSQVVSDWDLLLSNKALLFSDGAAAPDIAIERFDDGAGVILINNGSGEGPTSYFGADGTVWALTARDFSGPYTGLTPTNIYLNNGTADRTISVDGDGDLAIDGVGKIAIQP